MNFKISEDVWRAVDWKLRTGAIAVKLGVSRRQVQRQRKQYGGVYQIPIGANKGTTYRAKYLHSLFAKGMSIEEVALQENITIGHSRDTERDYYSQK